MVRGDGSGTQRDDGKSAFGVREVVHISKAFKGAEVGRDGMQSRRDLTPP